jgi:hypothetical protein
MKGKMLKRPWERELDHRVDCVAVETLKPFNLGIDGDFTAPPNNPFPLSEEKRVITTWSHIISAIPVHLLP